MSLHSQEPVQAAPQGALQPIYQLDHDAHNVLKKCREKVHNICSQHLNRPVRVQTVHGQTHDGYLVHIDSYYVYIQIMPGHSRAFLPYGGIGGLGGYGGIGGLGYGGYGGYGYGYPPVNPYYSNAILPLALFDLLAISLL